MSRAGPPPPASLRTVCRHVEAAYPQEGCGFVRRSGRVEPVRNVAETPERAFCFPFDDLVRFEAAFAEADPPALLFHGHPDASPAFSRLDAQAALLDGEPLYPVDHLIIEVRRGTARRYALYRFETGDFRLQRAGDIGAEPWSG